MCGIAGWFSKEPLGAGHETAALSAMMASIRHRGPDGEGREFLQHAAFGHMRLSIIDLAGGQQPLWSGDRSCLLIFNGEIYNYRQLRQPLIAAGYVFHTESDSEVVLAVYQHYGIDGFSKLRGMFAFALWDTQKNEGFLARDSCGIKPLFHARDEQGRLLFASEAKALVASGFIAPRLDEQHLHHVMNFRYLLGDVSLFRGIEQLAPGHVLRWSPERPSGAIHVLRVEPPPAAPILETLRDSVHSHLVADVEVGVHLSGGIDSAAILALASERSPLRTFTLAIGDDAHEAGNAAETARLLGAPNLCAAVDFDLREQLPKLIWHMEMPKVNALQVYLLASVSARHVKVALSGMGGDELFYGYNVYRLLWQYGKVRGLLAPLRKHTPFDGFKSSLMAPHYEWNEYDRVRAMVQHGDRWSTIYGLIRNVWDCPAHRRWIYGPRMLDARPPDAFEQLEARWPRTADHVEAAADFEWHNKLVNDLLWQEDRCSMAHGLESRVPFVDALVNARMSQFGRRELMPRGKLKARMRSELSALLPPAILERKKSGFQVDAPEFFRRHLATLAEEHLSPRKVHDHGLFNPDFVTFLLKLPVHKRYRWHYFMLYLIIGSHIWLDLFETRGAAACRIGTRI